MDDRLAPLPQHRRDAAQTALTEATRGARLERLSVLKGGASGAPIYRVDAGGRAFALRLEPERVALQHRRRGYACMEAAAGAGIAPRVYFADPITGIAVIDLIDARPIEAHPGGREGVARELGALIARIQTTAAFPTLPGHDGDLIDAALTALEGAGFFAPGLLGAHREQLARIRAAAPWEPSALVSSHNDPNPRNLLSDGVRLWLVDWELAARNAPLFDLAIATLETATTPDLETTLLTAALGAAPDASLRARLAVERRLARLFYGCIALEAAAAVRPAPTASLAALTPEQFGEAAAQGRLARDEIGRAFGLMSLAAFLDGCADPGFRATLERARQA